MPRARNVPASRRAKKRIFKRTKGFRGGRRNHYRTAKESAMRSDAYAYRDRRNRKRVFRRLWIVRINAACRQRGISYSRFVAALKAAGVETDRKMLAEIAVSDPQAFDKLVESVSSQPVASE